MSKEQQADVQDSYIKKVQDMADALRKAANDSSLTQEQIAAITQDIIDTGWEYLDAMGEQLSTSQKNMIMSFIDAAGKVSDEFGKDVHDIADKLQIDMNYGLGEVDKRFDTSVKQWIENEEEFQDSSNETRDTIIGNIGDFVGAVGDANISISEPLNDMDSDFNKIDNDIVSMKTDMEELFNLLGEKSGAFKTAAGDVKELQTQLHNAQNELSEYTQKIKSLEQKIAEQQVVITGYENEKNGGANGSGGNGLKAAPNGQVGDGVLRRGDDVYYSGGSKGYHDSLGNGPN
jgi:flagellar motility protein MotE (MotC chaperone)